MGVGVTNASGKQLFMLNKGQDLSVRRLNCEWKTDQHVQKCRPISDRTEREFTDDMGMGLDQTGCQQFHQSRVGLAQMVNPDRGIREDQYRRRGAATA